MEQAERQQLAALALRLEFVNQDADGLHVLLRALQEVHCSTFTLKVQPCPESGSGRRRLAVCVQALLLDAHSDAQLFLTMDQSCAGVALRGLFGNGM